MPVSDQTVINFTKAYARPFAALRLSEYYSAKKFLAIWGTRNINASIGTPTNVVVPDGSNSATSFDAAIVDNDLVNMWNRANDIVTDLEANSNAKLNQFLNVATVGQGHPIF